MALRRFRERSLRSRLTFTLVGLAAIGLILLAAITYGSQRRFLERQTDDRARAALPFIAASVVRRTNEAQATGQSLDDIALEIGGPPGGQGGDGDDDDGYGPGIGAPSDASRGRGAGPPGVRDLPLGTYGELRLSNGTRVGLPIQVVFSRDDQPSAPDLPAKLPTDGGVTVEAKDDSSHYRVFMEKAGKIGSEPAYAVVAIPLAETSEQLQQLLLTEGLVIAMILLILGLLASRLVRSELQPLEQIATDADAIAAGELDRRVPEAMPGTEVGSLSAALNAMLSRIEKAFSERQASEDKLRSFLSDASHELRTPLASIRGYAELQRTGMLATEDDKIAAASRIEEQAARMGTLVEDLLALARLDEHRETGSELVELAAIARDAVADAQALDAGREVTLQLDAEPVVVSDERRLRQVLTNLLGNAVAHTPDGTPIAATVTTESSAQGGVGSAVIHVDDAGAGIPEDKRDLIFKRFHREAGGTARTRGPAGAGLGLAVVQGIVEASGGTVTVDDSPLGGARFTVRLPLAQLEDDG